MQTSDENDYSCIGYAKITEAELAKSKIPARILWLPFWKTDPENPNIKLGHAFVVPDHFNDEELPLNRMGGLPDKLEDGSDVTAGYLRQYGDDITEHTRENPPE